MHIEIHQKPSAVYIFKVKMGKNSQPKKKPYIRVKVKAKKPTLLSQCNRWTFFYFQGPPYFTRAPTNATLRVGEDVILPCQANGDPPPKTRWRRIGAGYPPDGSIKPYFLALTPR